MLLLSNLQAVAEVQNTDILLGQVGQSLSSTLIVELVTEKKATESAAGCRITTEVRGRVITHFPCSHTLPQAPTDASKAIRCTQRTSYLRWSASQPQTGSTQAAQHTAPRELQNKIKKNTRTEFEQEKKEHTETWEGESIKRKEDWKQQKAAVEVQYSTPWFLSTKRFNC